MAHFFKNKNGQWVLDEIETVEDALKLDAIDVELPMKDIYHRVHLEKSIPSE